MKNSALIEQDLAWLEQCVEYRIEEFLNSERAHHGLPVAPGFHTDEADDYWTPLHYAARYGKKEIVEILIAKIIGDKNPQNRKGFPETGTVTPETLAKQNGHYDIVKMIKNVTNDDCEVFCPTIKNKPDMPAQCMKSTLLEG